MSASSQIDPSSTLTSVATIAAGGGVLGGPSRQVLDVIAADLGMTPAHARGVIDQALDPTTR